MTEVGAKMKRLCNEEKKEDEGGGGGRKGRLRDGLMESAEKVHFG